MLCLRAQKYPLGVGRRSPLQQSRVFLVELDKLDQVLDSEVGERWDAVFSVAIDPDHAVLDLHFDGDVPQPIFVFAEVLGDLGNGGDVMNLVDLVVVPPLERRALMPASNSRQQFVQSMSQVGSDASENSRKRCSAATYRMTG